jgi:colanic acid biosynthesis glycosyl transferase WcaI
VLIEHQVSESVVARAGDGELELKTSSAEPNQKAEPGSQAAVTPARPAYPPPAASPTQLGNHGIRYDFNMGARILVPSGNWRVQLRDLDTGNILFETTKGDVFVNSSKRYFIRFRIEAWKDGESVFTHEYDATDREVLVQFPVGTLGDIMGWFPYAVRFQQERGCKLTCAMSELLIPLFKDAYPHINFVTHEQVQPDRFYATYSIGLFFDDADNVWQPCDFGLVGLHRTAGYILGVDPEEMPPSIVLEDASRPIAEPHAASEGSAFSRAPKPAAVAQRVLIYGINYAPEPTGVGRYTGEIGSYLAQQGLEVEVVAATPHYPGWAVQSGYRNRFSVERLDRVRVTRCPLLLAKEMRGVWRALAPLTFALTSAPIAIWRIFSTRPDVVLCIEPTMFSAPAALLAAKIVGARTVLHVQDMEIDAAFAVGHLRGSIFRKIANFFECVVLRSFDRVVTISNRMQGGLRSKGVLLERLNLVRNWVDLEKIKPLNRVSSYRKELGLSDRSFVALYAGNIGAKQALPLVLEAAERLAAESNLIFVVVGNGPEKKQLMTRYGYLPNVRFLPVQPEERLCELLNLANVHLLPQDGGTVDIVFPSKLGGMLASGKPCIVMADPGTELFEFLGDGAIVLPAGDSHLLAKAVERIFCEGKSVALGSNRERIAALDAKYNLPAFKAILANGK